MIKADSKTGLALGSVVTLPTLTIGTHGLACATLGAHFIVSGGDATQFQAQKLNLE